MQGGFFVFFLKSVSKRYVIFGEYVILPHLLRAATKPSLLTDTKVQEVLTLLGQGWSWQETAVIAGVSRASVYRIKQGLHSLQERDPEKFLLPCCASRQGGQSAPFSPGADSFSLPSPFGRFPILGLELKEEHRVRYEEIRRKVEQEIADGIRER